MELKQKDNITYCIIPKNEIELIDFVLSEQPRATLEAYYKKQERKPDVIINGGFFALSTGETVFDYVDEYLTISSNATWPYGMGITDNGELKYGKNNEKWRDFVSAYPTLLVNGEYKEPNYEISITGKHRRSILGYNDTTIFVITVDLPGMTFKESADFAKEIGCTYAINLDGGGSTRLLYKGKAYAKAVDWNRPVDNIIAFYVREPIIFRVQVGAFLIKANADKFVEMIRALGGVYENAYVKYVSPYYKVQVGAFENKTYAINMRDDLISKGYDAFILTST